MHFRPAEPHELPFPFGEEEAGWVEPTLALTGEQRREIPVALIGMPCEGAIVDLEPRVLVGAGAKGPKRWAGRRACGVVGLEWKRSSQLAYRAVGAEAEALEGRDELLRGGWHPGEDLVAVECLDARGGGLDQRPYDTRCLVAVRRCDEDLEFDPVTVVPLQVDVADDGVVVERHGDPVQTVGVGVGEVDPPMGLEDFVTVGGLDVANEFEDPGKQARRRVLDRRERVHVSRLAAGRLVVQDEARRALAVDERLEERYPGTAASLCALRFETPFQLLVATVLSAQTTDAAVNLVTPGLFARYPDAEALAHALIEQVEALVRPTGFYRTKTRHIVALAAAVVERFGGEVPQGLEELTSLPGVGRKTANVVRSVGFGLPGLPVDTHVKRVSRRIGIARSSTPEGIEQELCAALPPERWGTFSLRMILHGRETCTARRPLCAGCTVADLCEAHHAGRC